MPKKKQIDSNGLIKGSPTPTVEKMIGKTFERLTVVSYAGYKEIPSGQKYHYVWCLCACGKRLISGSNHINHGNCISCGCYQKDHPSRFKHGFAPLHGKRDKIYQTWQGIHKRCKGLDNKRKYREKNIVVCSGWSGENGFENFKKDMGTPTDKSIDRINNDLHYSCGHCSECIKNGWGFNCRWANDYIQSNNRGDFNRCIVVNGTIMNHRAADRYLGYPIGTIKGRKNRGWTDEEAISIFPKMGNRKPKLNGSL